jgi:hypothetical protein
MCTPSQKSAKFSYHAQGFHSRSHMSNSPNFLTGHESGENFYLHPYMYVQFRKLFIGHGLLHDKQFAKFYIHTHRFENRMHM